MACGYLAGGDRQRGDYTFRFSASIVLSFLLWNRASSCFHAFENASHFCVNTLMPGQENISDVFEGKNPVEDRFALGEWREGLKGVPVLAHASVSFECELTNAVDEATHRTLFGRVIDIREHEEQAALRYCMRRYLNG